MRAAMCAGLMIATPPSKTTCHTPKLRRSQSMEKLLLPALVLAAYIVEGKPWNSMPEDDFDNGTNIQVWQCKNSTGQKW